MFDHAAYEREWRKKNRERWNEIKKKSRAKNPESHRRTNAAWKEANPEARKAHGIVQRALLSGRLVQEPCKCGREDSQAHHADYSTPLEVEWLCPVCHADEHSWAVS